MPTNLSMFQNAFMQPKSVAEYANDFGQIQNNALARTQSQMQIDAAKRATQQEDAYNQLAKGFGTDIQSNVNALRQGGLGARADSYLKAAQDAQEKAAKTSKDMAETEATKYKLQRTKYENGINVLVGSQTPQDAIARINKGVTDGAWSMQEAQQKISEIPQDPNQFQDWRQRELLGIVSAKDQIDHAIRQQEFGLKQDQFGEVVRHNKSAEGIQVRGQDVVAATAAAARQQADEHFKTAQASGGKAVAATEDERKAAGWLSQADNAWKNMQAAMGGVDPKTGEFKDASVARPGVADAIASIPSFGLGEVVGNSLRSPERQKFNQAASSLSEAILRAATGAGVNKDEALQKIRELTPVFGEDPATTKQKMDSIPMYLSALKQRAGRAIPQVSSSGNGGGVVDFGSLK